MIPPFFLETLPGVFPGSIWPVVVCFTLLEKGVVP
jgi:hypothetical protein